MRISLPFTAVALILVVACSPQKKEAAADSKQTLDSLLKNYHEDHLKLYPLLATSIGDNRYNALLPNDITAEYRQQVKAFNERYRDQLKAIDRTALAENDQLSYDLLTYDCGMELEALLVKDYLIPISQFNSMILTEA